MVVIMMLSKESHRRMNLKVILFRNLFNLEGEPPEDLAKCMKVALWYLNPATLPPLLLVGTQLKELDKEVGLLQRDLSALVPCESHHLLTSLDNIRADADFLDR